MKFDSIVGNPPYQSGKDSGNYSYWPKFIVKSSDILIDEGYLSFIVPQSWASNESNPDSRVRDVSSIRNDVLSKGHLINVDFTIGNHFSVASTFSSILWQKKSVGITNVTTIDGKYTIDYNLIPWLPIVGGRIGISILNKSIWNPKFLMEKLINDGREFSGYRVGSNIISPTQNTQYNWPIVNTSAQYTKNQYLYSSKKHPYQSAKKVIFSDSGYTSPFYDDGKYGLGHHARGIEVTSKKHGDIVISTMNSKLMIFVSSTKPSSGSGVGVSKVQDHIIKLPYAMTDSQIYDHLGLTQEEIDYLEKVFIK